MQTGVGGWSKSFARQVRRKCENYGMFLEGQISLPKDQNDLERFESEITTAKEAGANIHRVALGGRRYEQFDKLEQFKAARERAWMKLRLAEPIATKHRVKIGIENHKDWRITDMMAFMNELNSEYMGTCIDTGNSISLMEHPLETIQAFAKYAVTTHIKDMAVKEYEDGFLLSEVPIGEGFLHMNHLFDICEKANPSIQFSLEMITRDPLKIPCLTEKYWTTFEEMKGSRLAKTLAMVRELQTRKELPKISRLNKELQYKLEEDNIAKCLSYAENTLGLNG
ncbi:sugar phosphate isomerase/epimerase [bacterium]|nr:sugar phosphate isomerase/epimerase [bacterium]